MNRDTWFAVVALDRDLVALATAVRESAITLESKITDLRLALDRLVKAHTEIRN